MENRNVWPILAALRFLFALIVAYAHVYFYGLGSFANLVRQFGSKVAVLGFFVISGYSIAHSITISPTGYYNRRAARILPLYFTAILFSLMPFWVVTTQAHPNLYFHFDLVTWLGQWLFLQGFAVSAMPTNMPFWSISIEVFFYALTPWLLKKRLRYLIMVSILSVTICTLNNFWGIQSELYGFNVAQVAWAWLLGFAYYRSKQSHFVLCLIAVSGLVVFQTSNPYSPLAWVLWIAFCFALLQMKKVKSLNANEQKLMTYAGDLSYPMYLLHFPTTMCILVLVKRPAPELCIASGLIVAILAYHLIDLPFRKLARSRSSASLKAHTLPPDTLPLGSDHSLTGSHYKQ